MQTIDKHNKVAYYASMSLNNTQTTEIELYRDGQLDPTYKRKQTYKHIKQAVAVTAHVSGALVKDLAQWTGKKLEEVSRPVRLDIFDYVHKTNLRAQYFSGKRTQEILRAKRTYGLM